MISAALVAAGLLLALAAGLAAALTLARRRIRRLERGLDETAGKLEHLQVQFNRFAPEDVVEQLSLRGAATRSERRWVTVMFADLQGFTRLCDRFDPLDILRILNGYFQRMDGVIAKHHGRITELLGDGLLALFGALESNPWQARDAVLAALEMRAELLRYNGELRTSGLPELQFGIGIHRGEVIAGVIGSPELSKFGVIGDPINVASRVEGLTRQHGVDLLITEAVRTALDGRFRLREMPPLPVKGKSEPIVTYHVQELASATMADAPALSPAQS